MTEDSSDDNEPRSSFFFILMKITYRPYPDASKKGRAEGAEIKRFRPVTWQITMRTVSVRARSRDKQTSAAVRLLNSGEGLTTAALPRRRPSISRGQAAAPARNERTQPYFSTGCAAWAYGWGNKHMNRESIVRVDTIAGRSRAGIEAESPVMVLCCWCVPDL